MKTMKNVLVVVIAMMVVGVLCAGSVKADLVYTTGIGEGSISAYASGFGIYFSRYRTIGGFTVNGEPCEDVWAIVISEIGGEMYFNGYGRSWGDGDSFDFYIYGDSINSYSQASIVIPIINDDNPELFWINEITGQLTIGLGDDIVLPQSSISINGGAFGDVSSIVFDENNFGPFSLDSVALVTVPEPATIALLVVGGLMLLRKKK